ncbi:MAG: hypothetical protein F6J93_31370 [Oscillatoria sp. SIO1A7]|nr:hypothetical protein [Oscillatoria sp. SIO1A7]
MGRSAKICLVLVGQSVKSSTYGFPTKDAFLNLSLFALRDLALPASNEYLATTIEKRAFAKAIAQRQQEAEREIAKGFYCFYRLPGGTGKLGDLPPPPDFNPFAPGEVPVPEDEVPLKVPPKEKVAKTIALHAFQPELKISESLGRLIPLVERAEREEADLQKVKQAVEDLQAQGEKLTMTAAIGEALPETFTSEGKKSARPFESAKKRIRQALFSE